MVEYHTKRETVIMRKHEIALVVFIVVAMVAGCFTRFLVDKHGPIARAQESLRAHRSLTAYARESSSTDVGIRSDVDLRPLQVFYEVLQRVRGEYVEPIKKSQERDLAYGAIQNMLDSLHDPLTRFYNVKQAEVVTDAAEGRFYGIGAITLIRQEKQGDISEEKLMIASVLPGSPANKAGLQSGDIITHVDGKSILSYDPFQRVEKMIKAVRNGQMTENEFRKQLEAENKHIKDGISFRQAEDTLASETEKSFSLTIARSEVAEPIKVSVPSAETRIDPVVYRMIKPSVGYIRIGLMNKSAVAKLDRAVSDLKTRGATSIVLDLRDFAGGTLESAQAMAADFVPEKVLSILRIADGKQRTLRATSKRDVIWENDIVVLVNRASYGLSEVLAAAIRDGAGAKIVGERTTGANLQQTFVPLKDGSAFTMTTGKYLTPKSGDYRGMGLVPDVFVAAGKADGSDIQLERAMELLVAGKGKG